jgi:hypothetical protein
VTRLLLYGNVKGGEKEERGTDKEEGDKGGGREEGGKDRERGEGSGDGGVVK